MGRTRKEPPVLALAAAPNPAEEAKAPTRAQAANDAAENDG